MASDEFSNDPESQAICSALAGYAAAIFVIGGMGTYLRHVGAVLGVVAIVCGVRALRGAANNKKMAESGAIAGTVAVAVYLVGLAYQAMLLLWRLIG
jgi:hypothetical protein